MRQNSARLRLPGLDLIRICLALLIFMFHSNTQFQCNWGILDGLASMGAIAMTGFFLLSGYSVFISNRDSDLSDLGQAGRFYLKRIIRIIPLYYCTSIIYILLIGEESVLDNLLLLPVEALGLQSTFSTLFSVSHNGGTWFVSCILICYLIYPLLNTFIRQMTVRCRTITIFALVFILLWSPFVFLRFQLDTTYANPFYRALEFTIGALLAGLNGEQSLPIWMEILRKKSMAVASAVVLTAGTCIAVKMGISQSNFMLYSWLALPCFSIMIFASGSWMPEKGFWRNNRTVTYLSAISYAFILAQDYLWQPCNAIMNLIGTDTNLLRITLSLLMCLTWATLLHEIIEKPATKLLTRFMTYKSNS